MSFIKNIPLQDLLAAPENPFIQKRMKVLTLKKENERLRRFVQNIPLEIRQAIKQQQRGQRQKDYQR